MKKGILVCTNLKDGINYLVGFSKIQVKDSVLYGWEWSLDKQQAYVFDDEIHAQICMDKIGDTNKMFTMKNF